MRSHAAYQTGSANTLRWAESNPRKIGMERRNRAANQRNPEVKYMTKRKELFLRVWCAGDCQVGLCGFDAVVKVEMPALSAGEEAEFTEVAIRLMEDAFSDLWDDKARAEVQPPEAGG